MTNLPVVPICTNVMVLDKPSLIVETLADLSRLSFFDGDRYTTPDVPNIREEINSQPIQARTHMVNPAFTCSRGCRSRARREEEVQRERYSSQLLQFPCL